MVIKNVSFGHSGNYTCEVTADTPSFSTATATAQMLVVGEFFFSPLRCFITTASVCLHWKLSQWHSHALHPQLQCEKDDKSSLFVSCRFGIVKVVDGDAGKKSSSIVPLTKFMCYFSSSILPCRTSWISTDTLHRVWSIWAGRCA